MSSIRTSDSANLALMQQIINSNKSKYNTLTQQIAANSKYLKRSDDAAATNKASLIDSDETKQNQLASNVSTVSSWETATYSYLSDISSQMKSAVTVSTEANSTINEPTGWASLATQLDSIIDSLTADGNATYLGTSIFAGVKTSSTTDTFTTTTDPVTGLDVVSYNGSTTDKRSTKTSTSSTSDTEYGTLGSEIFNNVSITTSSGTTRSDFSSLQALVDLRDYLKCKGELTSSQLSAYQSRYDIGTETLDSSGIFSRILDVVEAGSTQVSQCMADNSARSTRFTSLTATINNASDTDETQYSNLVGVDTVKAATSLASIQTALTASYTLAGNLSKESLINYI